MAAESDAKRPRHGESPGGDASATAAWTLTLDDWMKAWQPGGGNSEPVGATGDDTSGAQCAPGLRAADEEYATLEQADQNAREERRRLEQAKAEEAVGRDLSPLVADFEREVQGCDAFSTLVDAADVEKFEEVFELAEKFDVARAAADATFRRCVNLVASLCQKLGDGAVLDETEKLQGRLSAAERALAASAKKVAASRVQAETKREDANRRATALRHAEEQERLFDKYDSDGDGLLNLSEVSAFVRRECNAELSQERVRVLLASAPFAAAGGVRRDSFERLRLLVVMASVGEALDGVEVEVAKAEAKARPLSARGPAAVPLARLGDDTADLDSAVDAAGDYLAAARAQADGVFEAAAGEAAAGEADGREALRGRLETLEGRLAKAAAVAEHCRGRMELQRRKAALLQNLGR